MLEGLREALEYIADLKEKSMDVKMEEIDGKIYCNKNLTRYHAFFSWPSRWARRWFCCPTPFRSTCWGTHEPSWG